MDNIDRPVKLAPGQTAEKMLQYYLTKNEVGKYPFQSMDRARMIVLWNKFLSMVPGEKQKNYWDTKIETIFYNAKIKT